jgi:GT2 family glycosyltransferase
MDARDEYSDRPTKGLTMPLPLVTVIVLNWNSAERTIACVETLRRIDYGNFQIYLVDNGSTDGSVDKLSRIEGVNFIRNPANLGYTGGNNAAMHEAIAAGTDYVWLLNSDTAVPEDCLARLVSMAETAPEIGLVSPVIRDNDSIGASQICCGIPDPHYPQWTLITDIRDTRISEQNRIGNLILYGTALLIKRTVIDRIGYLDEDLFAYCEDYDYSIRSVRAGFKNVVVIDACVFHDASNDCDRRSYYFYLIARNYLLVAKKHVSMLRYWRYAWWRYHAAIDFVRSNPSRTRVDAYLAGWWDGLRGHGGSFETPRSIPAVIRWALFPRLT